METDLNIEFYNALWTLFNKSSLSLTEKYFITKDYFNEIQQAFNKYTEEYFLYRQQQELKLGAEKEECLEIEIPIEQLNIKKENEEE